MRIDIELNDRLFYDIEKKAMIMEISVERYIAQLVEDKFYIDKYGDLNELLANKLSKAERLDIDEIKEGKKEETEAVEIKVPKKRGRKSKAEKLAEELAVKKEETLNIEVIPKIEDKVALKEEEIKKEANATSTDEVLKKVVKRTRVLKSK